jgi:DNA-binding NtrC family response regulator
MSETAGVSPGLRILLVDDEQAVLTAWQHDLSPLHGDVEAFTQPRQALARAGSTAFDLLITGYRMPGMDGLSLVKALKKLQPALIVIMLSGLADLRASMATRGATEGFHFLTKPWDAAELRALIHKALMARSQGKPQPLEVASPSSRPKGALATLEAKYPGITVPGSDWHPVRR